MLGCGGYPKHQFFSCFYLFAIFSSPIFTNEIGIFHLFSYLVELKLFTVNAVMTSHDQIFLKRVTAHMLLSTSYDFQNTATQKNINLWLFKDVYECLRTS